MQTRYIRIRIYQINTRKLPKYRGVSKFVMLTICGIVIQIQIVTYIESFPNTNSFLTTRKNNECYYKIKRLLI